MTIRATHTLVTESWTAAVQAIEAAVRRFRTDAAVSNDCHVILFEVDRDDHLHCNVTHKYLTATAPGWIGPAHLPQGFVHNHIFSDDQPTRRIIRHIRHMVSAAPI